MRLSQREIKDFGQIIEVVKKCDTMHVAFFDKDFPYIVPVSYGYKVVGDKIIIYFHSAKEGKKVALIEQDNRVCIEIDVLNGYKETERGVTADYESIIGYGRAEKLENLDEIEEGLEMLLKHCNIQGDFASNCAMTKMTNVYKIELESFTGKKRF